MSTPIHELVPLILEAKRFFTLGLPRDGEELDSIHRGVMSRLTIFWYGRTSIPGRASTDLMKALDQCESTQDSQALGRLKRMKDTFDKALEDLLVALSEINVDSISGFIQSPTIEEREKITANFLMLQVEIANKTSQLVRFQQCVNERMAQIIKASNFSIYEDTIEDDCQEEDVGRYKPSTQFLPERWVKSQITVETNSITSQQMKELRTYLLSGSSFSTHWEPVGWI